MKKIPLFPYANHILPDGRTQLKIAQARHIRMVKEALISKKGFVMAMIDNEREHSEIKDVPALSTHVKIIDFNRLEGDLLGITVEGIDLLKIEQIKIEDDKLLVAECTPVSTWAPSKTTTSNQCLAQRLKQLYSSQPEMESLYPTPLFDDMTWVCQRWLEVLPIEVKYKQMLIHQKTPNLAIRFLIKLLQDKNLNH
ncbi:LON peptidase substrate-binding domain-containing protein [Photobacterium sp. GB-210]|uniref:LON peptidase substrate-binding domain-containing protein n=1 Tax=Photobacterium sp. GB-210 TaxID=2022104 RepID=UPI000D17D00F|nr:LON peptidase substrate-binding domain-containing protein [Photobacterium sp. GB-210]PSV39981.1 Lon protease [Photobacterium sp. GB-210]